MTEDKDKRLAEIEQHAIIDFDEEALWLIAQLRAAQTKSTDYLDTIDLLIAQGNEDGSRLIVAQRHLEVARKKSNERRDALMKTQWFLQPYNDGYRIEEVDCVSCGRPKTDGCTPDCWLSAAIREE